MYRGMLAKLGLATAGALVAAGGALWLTPAQPAVDRAVVATEAWQEDVAAEPNVWWDGQRWVMVYTAGWRHSVLAYATAEHAEGPWTQRGRILGEGFGGWDGPVAHSSVYVENGVHYVYFPENLDSLRGPLRVAVGTDLEHLSVLGAPVLTPPAKKGATAVANTAVVKDGDVYRMLYDARVTDPAWWVMGYATADSPLGPFTTRAFPLPSLQDHQWSMYGGGNFRKLDDGTWELWYHAAVDGATTLPTSLHRATSRNLIDWKPSRSLLDPVGDADQFADPFLVWDRGVPRLFMSEMNNVDPWGRVVSIEVDRLL